MNGSERFRRAYAAFVAGDLDITSAADIRLGTSAVTGTSRFEAGNAPAIINGNNDFVGLVTVTGANEVWVAQNSLNPLRVAPLSADFMFFDSRQSNVQLSAGTYAATAGNIRIRCSRSWRMRSGPRISESSPAANRRVISICQSRSCAVT